jgi:hypothetical protein
MENRHCLGFISCFFASWGLYIGRCKTFILVLVVIVRNLRLIFDVICFFFYQIHDLLVLDLG